MQTHRISPSGSSTTFFSGLRIFSIPPILSLFSSPALRSHGHWASFSSFSFCLLLYNSHCKSLIFAYFLVLNSTIFLKRGRNWCSLNITLLLNALLRLNTVSQSYKINVSISIFWTGKLMSQGFSIWDLRSEGMNASLPSFLWCLGLYGCC